MPAVEETTVTENSSRLTFRQKFWLFVTGVPVLLTIVFFVLLVILPKPAKVLNPTEQKLLGEWLSIAAADDRGYRIQFDGNGYACSDTKAYLWEANEDAVYFEKVDRWTRLKTLLGLSTPKAEWRIEALSGDELKMTFSSGHPTRTYVRANFD